ncbi:hypothetical protein PC129_g18455 [Phytophthora cactorum]|uniref:Chromo domain-containing protein n=1 Tax=Phytophthora cactorum TaxID=29920 RepID=A0A329SJI6_9STRA|nr:hypothetical protein Pcac1_g26660 [Phytophthora cactorum]KAG2793823.1 hypothetical protein PC111_g22871 [Phytophthora cactorum]KAG2816556.1 hypothetical protein PC113_g23073 [Phytophthora cactorum]KAG2873496.1 hypothetical protein PC114_g25822 [Phytophthora cactorum]KAG2885168.1 hypothetical protein PC117_g25640 [Phytophthora cactorum]
MERLPKAAAAPSGLLRPPRSPSPRPLRSLPPAAAPVVTSSPAPSRSRMPPMKRCWTAYLIGVPANHPRALLLSPRLALIPPPPRQSPRLRRRLQLQEVLYELRVEGSSSDENDLRVVATQPGDAPAAEGLDIFADSDDDGTSVRPKRSRLRRGDEDSSWHPPLPQAPSRHPATNQVNHYNPDDPWGYDSLAEINRLIDGQGEPPHRCFLVDWKDRPLQSNWV